MRVMAIHKQSISVGARRDMRRREVLWPETAPPAEVGTGRRREGLGGVSSSVRCKAAARAS